MEEVDRSIVMSSREKLAGTIKPTSALMNELELAEGEVEDEDGGL
tara:strand:- start:696 stop:830 length:135 start_codon:yes stop_codon:yes gene_type:complete